jgi:predicted nucleic acid-binding protein
MNGIRVAEIFVDTNVLLYAISTAQGEQKKAAVARSILQNADWGWSSQIAGEFVRASTSAKQSNPLSFAQARSFVQIWMAFPLIAVDGGIVLDAIDVAQRFQISYFDAQVVAAAKRLGCKQIRTEDLNHGQDYGGVVVVNPFME